MSSDQEETGVITPAGRYRAALEEHRLLFQHCTDCGHNWLPAATECPNCLSPDFEWAQSGGKATIISWVNFHVAFDNRFKDRTPYNVALVDLDEGPRLITNISEIPAGQDVTGRRVTLVFEHDMGRELPRFLLADDDLSARKRG